MAAAGCVIATGGLDCSVRSSVLVAGLLYMEIIKVTVTLLHALSLSSVNCPATVFGSTFPSSWSSVLTDPSGFLGLVDFDIFEEHRPVTSRNASPFGLSTVLRG